MKSIAQMMGKFMENFLEIKITEGIGASWEKMSETFRGFVSEYMRARLEELDEELYKNEGLRKGWKVVKKGVSRTLACEFGEITYQRRYYRNEETGCYAYLADAGCGDRKRK